MSLAEMDLQEVIGQYADHTGYYNYEGERGVDRLGKLCKALGYGDSYQDPLLAFLADNSGAIEAMIEWIGQRNDPNWKEKLIEHLKDDGFVELDDEELEDE